MKNTVYDKIEEVMRSVDVPLAVHEFRGVSVMGQWALQHLGISESSLGRRLREMREVGRVTGHRRDGSAFVEYVIAVRVPAPEPVCPV